MRIVGYTEWIDQADFGNEELTLQFYPQGEGLTSDIIARIAYQNTTYLFVWYGDDHQHHPYFRWAPQLLSAINQEETGDWLAISAEELPECVLGQFDALRMEHLL